MHPANKQNFRADRDLSGSNLARDGAVIAVDHSFAGFKCRCDLDIRVRVDYKCSFRGP